MVKIKNISTARVVIALPSIRLHREIVAGAAMPFSDEEYQYLTFDPGFNTLIEGHYIVILDAPKIDGEVVETNVGKVFEAKDIEKMLRNRNITEFAKFIPKATEAEREAVKKYAVELRITDAAFSTLIKKYCGIDVTEAVSAYNQTVGAEN